MSSDESRVVLDLRKRIDEIDRIILVELERDGRISNKNLAMAAGVSQSTCLERVRKLERADNLRLKAYLIAVGSVAICRTAMAEMGAI